MSEFPATRHTDNSIDLGPLAKRIVAGNDLTEPLRINDFIFESPDLSNSFLITTSDGNVIINTGATGNGQKHKARYATVSRAPVRYIVLTQSHIDHISGIAELRNEGTQTIAQQRFMEIARSRRQLAEFWQARKDRLLKSTLGNSYSIEAIDIPCPDITYEHHFAFDVGERRFELYHTPGGEALDGSVVWLPQERILFTGNLFGPIIGHLPNLYTIRGERIRSAMDFVRCVNLTLDLKPELVIEGHANGETLDAATFRQRAIQVRDAVQWLHDATIAGMNAGKNVWTLMDELRMPPGLQVPQTHGRLPWCIRAVWEEYAGWFHYDSTTSLYEVRASAIHPDLVELAGGVAPILARARDKLNKGKLLEALHLAEIALTVEPAPADALQLSCDIHEKLLEASGRENFFETLWLLSCIAETDRKLSSEQ